jgi:hypothetical protein
VFTSSNPLTAKKFSVVATVYSIQATIETLCGHKATNKATSVAFASRSVVIHFLSAGFSAREI